MLSIWIGLKFSCLLKGKRLNSSRKTSAGFRMQLKLDHTIGKDEKCYKDESLL